MAYQHQKLDELYSRLTIEEEEADEIILGTDEVVKKSTEFVLVGRFLTEKNLNFNAMQNVIASLWRPIEGMEVHDIGGQRYVFILYHIMDVKKVLEGGPWSFDKSLLVLHMQLEGEDPQRVQLMESDIWVQVHDLLKGFASVKVLENVEIYIERYVRSDTANFEGNWKPFFRIRVTIRVDKPLKRRMKIKREGGN